MIISGQTAMGTSTLFEMPPVHVERGSLERQLLNYITHHQKIEFLENYVTYCDAKINRAVADGKYLIEAHFTACKGIARDLMSAEIKRNG